MVSGLFRGGCAAQLDAVAFELDRHDVLQHQAGPRLRPLVGSRDVAQRRPQGVLQRGGGLDRDRRPLADAVTFGSVPVPLMTVLLRSGHACITR